MAAADGCLADRQLTTARPPNVDFAYLILENIVLLSKRNNPKRLGSVDTIDLVQYDKTFLFKIGYSTIQLFYAVVYLLVMKYYRSAITQHNLHA
jgi:hypothetical protein